MKLSFLSAFNGFAFLLLFQSINAQNRDGFKIDSLLKVAAKAKHDTTRYTAFQRTGNIYQYSNTDSALFFHAKALQIAISLKDEIKRSKSLMETGRDYFFSGNEERALRFYNEALQIAEKEISKAKNKTTAQRAKKLKGSCLYYLAGFYNQQNDFVKALEYYRSALTIGRETQDTLLQIRILGTTGMIYLDLSEKDKALKDLEESERLARILNHRANLAVLYGNIGLVYRALGDNEKAIEYYNKAMKIDQEDGNTSGVTRHLSNTVTLYRVMGNYAKALEYAFRSLKISEQNKDARSEGYILGDIAIIYTLQGQVDKAVSFYIRALKKCEEAKDTKGIAAQYTNLGIAYMTQGQETEKKNITLSNQKYALALSYYSKADSLFVVMNDINSQANTLTNIAIIYGRQGNTDKAISCLEKAVDICIKTDDKSIESVARGNLGSFYSKKGNYKEAEKNLLLSLKIAEEVGAVNEIKVAHEFLSSVYDKTNKPALAYKHYKAFVNYRDSLTSVENTRASVEQEMKFNFEKKTVADSIKVAADKQITLAQLKQEKTQRYSLYGGLVLVALFALFMFQRFRLTNKQKKIIELQKHTIEEKQKEMLDSIHYAKRIQRAMLTSEKYIQRKMKELI